MRLTSSIVRSVRREHVASRGPGNAGTGPSAADLELDLLDPGLGQRVGGARLVGTSRRTRASRRAGRPSPTGSRRRRSRAIVARHLVCESVERRRGSRYPGGRRPELGQRVADAMRRAPKLRDEHLRREHPDDRRRENLIHGEGRQPGPVAGPRLEWHVDLGARGGARAAFVDEARPREQRRARLIDQTVSTRRSWSTEEIVERRRRDRRRHHVRRSNPRRARRHAIATSGIVVARESRRARPASRGGGRRAALNA